MKFGSMTDNDNGKNPLNLGHDPRHDPDLGSERNTFSFKSTTCRALETAHMLPLDSAIASWLLFNISFCGIYAL